MGVFKDRLLRLLGALYMAATIASTGDTTIHVRSQLAIVCRCSSQHSLTQNITSPCTSPEGDNVLNVIVSYFSVGLLESAHRHTH